jgi:hypothetical protein
MCLCIYVCAFVARSDYSNNYASRRFLDQISSLEEKSYASLFERLTYGPMTLPQFDSIKFNLMKYVRKFALKLI